MTASNDPPGTDDFGTRLVIARGAGNLIHPSGRIMSSTKPAEPMDIKQRFGEVTEMSRKIEDHTYLSYTETCVYTISQYCI